MNKIIISIIIVLMITTTASAEENGFSFGKLMDDISEMFNKQSQTGDSLNDANNFSTQFNNTGNETQIRNTFMNKVKNFVFRTEPNIEIKDVNKEVSLNYDNVVDTELVVNIDYDGAETSVDFAQMMNDINSNPDYLSIINYYMNGHNLELVQMDIYTVTDGVLLGTFYVSNNGISTEINCDILTPDLLLSVTMNDVVEYDGIRMDYTTNGKLSMSSKLRFISLTDRIGFDLTLDDFGNIML